MLTFMSSETLFLSSQDRSRVTNAIAQRASFVWNFDRLPNVDREVALRVLEQVDKLLQSHTDSWISFVKRLMLIRKLKAKCGDLYVAMDAALAAGFSVTHRAVNDDGLKVSFLAADANLGP
ncbi:MAG: hypothetical protein ABL985_01845 [Casimicrobium sp.]